MSLTDYVLEAPPELVAPNYTIHRYTDNIYKIVYFKNPVFRCSPPPRGDEFKYDGKLSASKSRARKIVLELALCNLWKYFCTFTLDKTKYDRYDIKRFHKDFTQWIKDQRKKYPDVNISYLLVPEQHQDGAWHMHGLFSDISILLNSFDQMKQAGYNVPEKLVKGNYYCWLDCWKKFGFNSLGLIKEPVAVGFYVSKYIFKQLDETALSVGDHLYYCSRPLNRAVKHGDVYGYWSELDRFLDRDYDFVKTGFTKIADGVNWDFALEYMEDAPELIQPLFNDQAVFVDVDNYMNYTQEAIEGF